MKLVVYFTFLFACNSQIFVNSNSPPTSPFSVPTTARSSVEQSRDVHVEPVSNVKFRLHAAKEHLKTAAHTLGTQAASALIMPVAGLAGAARSTFRTAKSISKAQAGRACAHAFDTVGCTVTGMMYGITSPAFGVVEAGNSVKNAAKQLGSLVRDAKQPTDQAQDVRLVRQLRNAQELQRKANKQKALRWAQSRSMRKRMRILVGSQAMPNADVDPYPTFNHINRMFHKSLHQRDQTDG